MTTSKTAKRRYNLTKENSFVVSSIALLSSIKIIPSEMFGIIIDPPIMNLYMNGLEIKNINQLNENNYFDFKFIRYNLNIADPYTDEGDYDSNTIELYNLEQVLVSGQLDAMSIYNNLSDEELSSSVFTPYVIIRFESDSNMYDSITIEEEYYIH